MKPCKKCNTKKYIKITDDSRNHIRIKVCLKCNTTRETKIAWCEFENRNGILWTRGNKYEQWTLFTETMNGKWLPLVDR